MKRTLSPLLTIVFMLSLVPAAHGQMPGAAPAAPAPPAIPDKPGKVVGSMTVGGQIQNGLTETRGAMISGSLAYMNRRKETFRLDVLTLLAQYRATGRAPRTTVQDVRQMSLTFMHPLRPNFWFVEVVQSQHDITELLNHREMLSTGIAWRAIHRPRLELLLIPGINFGEQVSDIPHAPTSIFALGAYQMLNAQLTQTLSFTESAVAFRDLRDSRFHSMTVNSALTAKISKPLGLSVMYSYSHEGIRPVDAPASQSTLGVGLMLSL